MKNQALASTHFIDFQITLFSSIRQPQTSSRLKSLTLDNPLPFNMLVRIGLVNSSNTTSIYLVLHELFQ